jgi:hypothetical protein
LETPDLHFLEISDKLAPKVGTAHRTEAVMSAANLDKVMFGGHLGAIGIESFSPIARKVAKQICEQTPSMKFQTISFVEVYESGAVREVLYFAGTVNEVCVQFVNQEVVKFGIKSIEEDTYDFFAETFSAQCLNVWLRAETDRIERHNDTKFDTQEVEYREFLQLEEEANLLDEMFRSEDQTFPESARSLYHDYIEQGFYA